MILELSDAAHDQVVLADTVAAMIDKAGATEGLVQRVADSSRTGGYDDTLWQLVAGDLGACAVVIPESAGGIGASFAEAAVILEQLGSALSCVPFLSTLISEIALIGCLYNDKAAEVTAAVAAGDLTVATVLDEGSMARFTANFSTGSWMLSGSTDFVVDGVSADIVLIPVPYTTSGRYRLFLIDGSLLSRTRMDSTDLTRQLASISADAVPATLLSEDFDASRLRDIALIAQGCEQVGAAKRTLRMAVDYANRRVQFGRVIGSFQAIKHHLAEVAVAVELAESAVAHGVWAVVEGDNESLSKAACMVAMTCSDAALASATENIQVHGGIGFTWEHPAHLYYRRALSSAVLWGQREDHARRLFTLVGSAEPTVSDG